MQINALLLHELSLFYNEEWVIHKCGKRFWHLYDNTVSRPSISS